MDDAGAINNRNNHNMGNRYSRLSHWYVAIYGELDSHCIKRLHNKGRSFETAKSQD